MQEPLQLDFTGLAIDAVAVDGTLVEFTHDVGRIGVPLPSNSDNMVVEVMYRGVPDDGLIIGRNVHDQPTAFADNWPNRARFWFPGVDPPVGQSDRELHDPRAGTVGGGRQRHSHGRAQRHSRRDLRSADLSRPP